MSLLRLFFAFFQIGLFSIGGGYAIIPMISEQVVQSQHWLSAQEFTDIITISQMTPGPLAVNTSTFVGIGCICMGVCIAYGIYHIFQRFSSSRVFMEVLKGLKAGSLGLIMAAAAIIVSLAFFKEGRIAMEAIQIPAAFIFLIILFISRKWKMNPIALMMLSGVVGILFYQ